ncbi:MAG TPA: MFS transporter [Candidatus Cloacimonadota bacterium]|nr:MFS transporter [Candidatus Cloacimonadales bacterium]HPY95937.1 MFS transporter [Candidatus Cloacimonadota bacterium]HQB40397.1 MFS transporter [Candidatus Cloacimonadota bacterium]
MFLKKFTNRFMGIFESFKLRNYSLYFFGQGTSLIGTWIQRTALSWLIYRVTDSVLWLGLLGFVGKIPSLFITPFAGVIADRFPRHKILKISQILMLVQAFALFLIVYINDVKIWQILLLSTILGAIETFETPVRHAFVFDIVQDRNKIANAIGLNSAMFNTARLIGPALAGYLVAQIGEAYCFLINSFSFIAMLLALFQMKIDIVKANVKKRPFFSNLKEGFTYVVENQSIRYLLFNVCVFTLFGQSYTVILPYFAKEVFGGDSRILGLMVSAVGAGALFGAMYLASRKNTKGLTDKISNFGLLATLCLMVIAFSKIYYLSLILIFITSCGLMMQNAGSNTIIQNIIDEDKRGRVMSIYSMSFLVFLPLGSLLIGSASKYFGVERSVFASGLLCFLASMVFRFKVPLIKKKIKEKNIAV